MRILQIISGWGVNGAIIHCLELIRGLTARGHQVTLVCRPNAWIAKQLQQEPVEIVESKLGRFPPTDLRTIARLCRDREIDLVHTHQSRAHFFGVLMRRLFGGPPVVATAHRSLFQPHWAWNDLVIATSEETARFHQRWNLVPQRKMQLVHNFVQVDRFRSVPASEGQRVRRELNISPDDTLIGLIGSVEKRKGLIYLTQALPRLLQISSRVKILSVGFRNPDYMAQVMQTAAQLGVADHLILAGERSDVPSVLRAIDLLAMPSLDESLPLSLLEAMAVGLPIVATRVGGVPECIRDQIDGRLVPPANPLAMAEAIGGLISDPDRGRALGQSAADRIDAEFSPTTQIRRIEQQFERLVHKPCQRIAA